MFDRKRNKRVTWRSLIRAKKKLLFYLLFCHFVESPLCHFNFLTCAVDVAISNSRTDMLDCGRNKRVTWRSLIPEKMELVTHRTVLSFCHLPVQVTWRKSDGRL